MGSRERGRAQVPALRKSNSRQITAFSLKPSHNHSECCQGNGTWTGKCTPARRRGLHVSSLGPSLNFPSGAQVCQPGPAQRGSSSVCRMTIGHGGWPVPVCVINNVQVPCPGLSAQAFCCHTGPTRNQIHSQPASSHQNLTPCWLVQATHPNSRGPEGGPLSPRVDGGSMIVLLASEGRVAFSLAASPAAAPGEPSRTYLGRTRTGGHAHRTWLCMSPVPPVRCRCDLEPTSAPLGASDSSSVTSKGGILLLSALKDCYEDGFR